MATIERLGTEKLKLTTELKESNDRATEAIGLKQLVEEEVTRLKLTVQRAELENQRLQHQVETLTGMIQYLRSTTVKSIDDFASRLKFDLVPPTDKQHPDERNFAGIEMSHSIC